MTFDDHFSGHAREYARSRPTYPSLLVDLIAGLAPGRDAAVDCGTGSGQFAESLATRFARVVAVDAGPAQLAQVPRASRVHYVAARAEVLPIADRSLDLLTSAQAAHWFDQERFHGEFRRVARDGAIIALIAYGKTRIAPHLDEVIDEFHDITLREHWPARRSHVLNGYSELPFPFEPIEAPSLEMSADWSVQAFLEYIGTWSAVKIVERRGGAHLFEEFRSKIAAAWGDGETRRVAWPLALRLGRHRVP